MHALCKTLFFTTGTVGLLVLVFLWSALHYGLLKLNFLSDTILNYKFAGFYLTDFLLLSSTLDPGQRIHLIKLILSTCIGAGSVLLILLSYLPRVSWQFRSLSFVVSFLMFTALTMFWICLKGGSEVIRTSEKSAIFGFTSITYLTAIFLLWYAMRVKPHRQLRKTKPTAQSSSSDNRSTRPSEKGKDPTEEASPQAKSLSDKEQTHEPEKNDNEPELEQADELSEKGAPIKSDEVDPESSSAEDTDENLAENNDRVSEEDELGPEVTENEAPEKPEDIVPDANLAVADEELAEEIPENKQEEPPEETKPSEEQEEPKNQ